MHPSKRAFAFRFNALAPYAVYRAKVGAYNAVFATDAHDAHSPEGSDL
jgi:hypothetical protein